MSSSAGEIRGPEALRLVLVGAGLWASIHAFGVASESAEVVAQTYGADAGLIRGALVVGGLALVAAGSRPFWDRGRSASPVGSLRLLAEVLVVGWIVALFALQPFARAAIEVGLGLAAGAWGVLMLPSARQRQPASRLLKVIDLILWNVCLAVVLAELGLRLLGWLFPSPLLAQHSDQPSRVVWEKKTYLEPGALRLGFPLNSQSHYDTEFVPRPNATTIAMIGDSFSYGVVPHHFHFSTLCERELGVEVYNFGYPATGPLEYRHLLRTEVLPLAPDVVAVNVFVGNDFGEATRAALPDRRWRSWLDPENVFILELPKRLRRLRQERRARGGAAPVGDVEGQDVARRLQTVAEMIAVYPWLADPTAEAPTLIPETFLAIEKHRAAMLGDPARIRDTALFAVLRDMRRMVEQSGAAFVVQIIPDEFQVNDTLWRQVRAELGNRRLTRRLPQQRLGRWLEKEGIPYLDLLPVLRAGCSTRGDGVNRCYHLRNTHFNARGNRVAGEAMARFLEPWLR